MIADKIISNTLVHLHPDDTAAQALTIMHINYVKHLPVVREKELLGVVSEEFLLRSEETKTLGELEISDNGLYANVDDHMFEILGKLANSKLTSITVLDHDKRYVGLISQEDLLNHYANSFSFKEQGSIVVLEINKRSYSLSEMARIVELENASIICSFITEIPDSANVFVTIKVNRVDVQSIIRAFDRYDYQVKATYAEEEIMDSLKERYDALMNFLNV